MMKGRLRVSEPAPLFDRPEGPVIYQQSATGANAELDDVPFANVAVTRYRYVHR